MKTIRKSTLADIPEMLRIYSRAKAAMRASGNNSQWTGPYPGAEAAKADIARGWSHIVEVDGHAAGTFCLMDAPEPTYSGGNCTWLSDAPYLTLHRRDTCRRSRLRGRAGPRHTHRHTRRQRPDAPPAASPRLHPLRHHLPRRRLPPPRLPPSGAIKAGEFAFGNKKIAICVGY